MTYLERAINDGHAKIACAAKKKIAYIAGNKDISDALRISGQR